MAHSLTGASSRTRWKNCTGYLHLAAQTGIDPERLDPEYTREGTAAHYIAARCMTEGRDAWEFIGQTIEGCVVGEGDNEVSPRAIQEYVDHCRGLLSRSHKIDREHYWIETPVGADENKRPHPGFHGTLDFAVLDPDAKTLRVRDLKFGQGIYVDVRQNEQEMYYAYGLLLHLDDQGITVPLDWNVELGICQPRLYDYDGVKVWGTTVHEILKWGAEVLVPDMHKATEAVASGNVEYVPGEWCRFCPVKLKCPALQGMFRAACENVQGQAKAMTDDQLGEEFQLVPVVKMYCKAIDEETDYRLNQGRKVAHAKLAPAKVDRVWKSGALPAIRNRVGEAAMTSPVLKSPAQMEKVSDLAKQLTAEWAFKPQGKPRAVLDSDPRPAMRVSSVADTFAGFLNSDRQR